MILHGPEILALDGGMRVVTSKWAAPGRTTPTKRRHHVENLCSGRFIPFAGDARARPGQWQSDR